MSKQVLLKFKDRINSGELKESLLKMGKMKPCKDCGQDIIYHVLMIDGQYVASDKDGNQTEWNQQKYPNDNRQFFPINDTDKKIHGCKDTKKPGTSDSIKQQDLLDDTKTEKQPDKTGLLNLLCQEYKMGLDNQGLLDCFDIESKDMLGAWAAFTEICKKNGLNNTIEINMLFKIFLDKWTSNTKKGKKQNASL